MINYNEEKALLCVKLMKNYFNVYDNTATVIYPDIIKEKSIEHIYYLFYSCLLDYGMKSSMYHDNLVNTYKKYPNIFNPSYVHKYYNNNEKELLSIIKNKIHARYPNVALKKWLNLSEYLNNEENLLSKLNNFDNYNELYTFITSIKGYGQKTGGLLIRLIIELGISNVSLDNIPIDRHDIEISYLNGVINIDKLNSEQITNLGKIWVKSAKKYDVSASDIDKYLWSIGSKLCANKMCSNCPLKDNCNRK